MNQYTSQDICVLTPTKNRPNKIINLLNSLSEQTKKVGRIIIVGSGENIEKIVMGYLGILPVEYYHSEISGQIRQRKLGVTMLTNNTKLVATLDDDIILERDAIEENIKFWNTTDDQTAGIGFNIINMTKHSYSIVKEFSYLSTYKPGSVLTSGYTTSLVNVHEDIKTMWLNGGASIWLQHILIEGIHKKSIDSIWAPCEDVMFSYPIGKVKNLFICNNSKVVHDDTISYNSIYDAFNRGRLLSLWTFEFVKQNSELNKHHFYIATIFSSIFNIFKRFYNKKFFFELGRLSIFLKYKK